MLAHKYPIYYDNTYMFHYINCTLTIKHGVCLCHYDILKAPYRMCLRSNQIFSTCMLARRAKLGKIQGGGCRFDKGGVTKNF